MSKIDLSKIYTLAQLKRANKDAGYYFFSPSTMRFFNSRVCEGIKHTEGGNVFITSERFDDNTPRMYTIRIMRDDGSIDTISEFQQYKTLQQARTAVEEIK